MTKTQGKSLEKLLAAALTGLLIAGTALFALQPATFGALLHGAPAAPIYDFKL